MEAVRIIKKYPNRRLYDTQSSTYITLCEVRQLVLDQVPFRVVDAKTHQDLTRCILMQVILEQEMGETPLFSCEMLTQMIRSYGDTMRGFMGNYLEQGLRYAIDLQQQLRPASTDPTTLTHSPNTQLPHFPPPPHTSFQNLMGHYLAQSTQLLMILQQQVSEQAPGSPFPGPISSDSLLPPRHDAEPPLT
ncbi:MAG: polyhydroxyalkanoate synthesis repressor PhaR [Ferrovum sp.]|jgi:polyhydroxyalkanoate synthesis repressor PhaR|nr:polyhydroxyalkanoate synthesis repressor PhaR [Ferrovum sp.]NDU87234.1 polyhydroxyalkanoate synthesis repressor PhaR [Ferrovum sp.]